MTDFRLPENRRETFWTAYEFHLKFKTMPGLVYGYFPYLAKKLNWSMEQKLWFAFLNGNTQNPSTSWIIFNEFPSIADLDIDKFEKWYFSVCNDEGKLIWQKLPIDLDRRHFRNKLHTSIRVYQENLAGRTQEEFFMSYCNTDDKFQNFANLWDRVYKGDKKNGVKKFFSFGRLSAFSYIEFLWVMGLPLDCDRFFCEDYKGSSSHRNGMAILMGREDLDEHKSNPAYDKGDVLHNKDVIAMLDRQMEELYREALVRFKDNEIFPDVSRFTIESQLCNYKSWHRPSRRYPNVYGDMAYDRLIKVESMEEFKQYSFQMFWEARLTFMPTEIRPEGNPENLGITSYKQNLYRTTGRQHTLGLINDAYEGVPKGDLRLTKAVALLKQNKFVPVGLDDLDDAVYEINKLDDLGASFLTVLYYVSTNRSNNAKLIIDSWDIRDFSVKNNLISSDNPLKTINKRVRKMISRLESKNKTVSDYVYKASVYKNTSGVLEGRQVEVWHFTVKGFMIYFLNQSATKGFDVQLSLTDAVTSIVQLFSAMRASHRVQILDNIFEHCGVRGLYAAHVPNLVLTAEYQVVKEAYDEATILGY